MTKITLIGDIMCEPLLMKAAKRESVFDFNNLFNNDVVSLFKDSDYVIGNLETPLAGEHAGYCNNLYSFNAPDEFAEALKNAGIDFVTTSNNHCLDRGYEGLKRTLEILDKFGIKHCGTSLQNESRIGYFNIDNKRFALVCGTYGTNFTDNHESIPSEHPECVNMLRAQDEIPFYKTCQRHIPKYKNKVSMLARVIKKVMRKIGIAPWKIQQVNKLFHQDQTIPYPDNSREGELPSQFTSLFLNDLKKAKGNADYVIFYPHIGGQFNSEPGSFSNYIVNLAAKSNLCDVIVSSHPHVVQKAVFIAGIPCFYSLGNFNMSPNSYYIPDESRTDLGIAVHLYFYDGTLNKVTYSILRMVENRRQMMRVEVLDVCNRSDSDCNYIIDLVNGEKEFEIENNEVVFYIRSKK